MTGSVLPSDIDEQWQTLVSKIEKKAKLEVEAGSGKKKLCDMMRSHKDEQSSYEGDASKYTVHLIIKILHYNTLM